MQLPLQGFTTLMQNMAASVQGAANAAIDLTVGSVLRAILEANAAIALWMQWLIVQVLAQTRAATSNGTDLDSWVADFGMSRLPAQAASTTLSFSRITPGFPAVIAVGSQAKTSDGAQTFTVQADPTHPAFLTLTNSFNIAPSVTSISVPAVAAVGGAGGNVQAGAITLLATAIPGVDAVTNLVAAAGGQDAESDTALRSRFANFIDSRSRATPAAVAFTIQSLQQGLDYTLVENRDPSGASRPGFFTITIDDGSGSPSNLLIANVSSALEAVRPIGTQFAVQPPVLVIANISLTLACSTTNETAVSQSVLAALQAYVSQLSIGAPLPISRVSAIAYSSSTAITNVTNVTINGQSDLIVPANAVIKPGTITVN